MKPLTWYLSVKKLHEISTVVDYSLRSCLFNVKKLHEISTVVD